MERKDHWIKPWNNGLRGSDEGCFNKDMEYFASPSSGEDTWHFLGAVCISSNMTYQFYDTMWRLSDKIVLKSVRLLLLICIILSSKNVDILPPDMNTTYYLKLVSLPILRKQKHSK